jgi:hypothetical protein
MAKKRLKHNKKRNTAFLYESLVKELTRAILAKEDAKKETIVSIVKENFKGGTALQTELECYRNLLESYRLKPAGAEKLVFLTKRAHLAIDKTTLFNEQTKLINMVNKEVGKNIFANFVPNYKDLATVYQIFNAETPLKTKILLEEGVIARLASSEARAEETLLKPVDNLVYNTFVKKFNERYNGSLLTEQQQLLNTYILSFTDNGVDLKVYLNEEVGRLKEALTQALQSDEISSDGKMMEKTKSVISLLESFHKSPVDNVMIKRVLKAQQLVGEIQSDG